MNKQVLISLITFLLYFYDIMFTICSTITDIKYLQAKDLTPKTFNLNQGIYI